MTDEQYMLLTRMQATTFVLFGLLGFARTGGVIELGALGFAASYACAVERCFRTPSPLEGKRWANYANRLLDGTLAMLATSAVVGILGG